MTDEQLSNDAQKIFETLKEFIDTLKETPDSANQISGILTLLKTIIELLEADSKVSLHQSKSIHSSNESQQANMKGFIELYERVETLENNVSDLASNSAKLGLEVMKLAETAAMIPVVNVDNLLKTLNEHADEINENTASIKMIKDKLNF